MGDWKTFADKIKDLLKSKSLSAAKEELKIGLEKFPNHVNLLNIASDVYRASGDREKSLEYSEFLITHHPSNWNGYRRAAQDLIALKRFKEAQKQIQIGLEKIPNQINLKKLLAYTNAFNGITNPCISDLEKDSLSLKQNDLISYSSAPEFFKIIQSKRCTANKKNETHKKYLFVAGLGRSGTTALGRLLNISSKIAIYTELCNPYRIDGYSQYDLSEEAVSKGLKSHRHEKRNSIILEKSFSAELVGDKRPGFQFCAESSFDNLGVGHTKCIFIDRSLVDICKSSYKRSQNPNDTWSLDRGIEHTILMYNASCRQIIHIHETRPDIFLSFLFPSYDSIFCLPKKAIELFNFCGINLSGKEWELVDKFVEDSREYVNKKIDSSNPLEMQIQKSISFLLDRDAHEKFCNITGNHRNYLS